MRNTLFEAEGFSYNVAKVFIKSSIVIAFVMLNATDGAKHNRMLPSAFLSNKSHSSFDIDL